MRKKNSLLFASMAFASIFILCLFLYHVRFRHGGDDAIRQLAPKSKSFVYHEKFPYGVSDEGVSYLLTNHPDLEELTINSSGAITDKGFESICQMRNLRTLSLMRAYDISDGALSCLLHLQYLKHLDLTGKEFGQEGVDILCRLTSLEELVLLGVELTISQEKQLRTSLPTCNIRLK